VLFVFGDVGEAAGDVGDGESLEVEGHASAGDGVGDFGGFGGEQDEDGVGWGFFEGFEEGVEAGGADGLGFVEDDDAVVAGCR
jgi:hypothetical protein